MNESLSETFLTLIRQTLDPSGTSIHEAEAGITELLKNPDSLNSLFEIFDSSEEPTIKTSALVYINRLIFQHFKEIPQELMEATKTKIIEILQNEESSTNINSNVLQIIINILKHSTEWNALIDFILNTEHTLQQSFFYIKTILFPFYHDFIIENKEYLFNIFTHGLESGDPQLIIETVSVIAMFEYDKRLFPNDDHLNQIIEFINEFVKAKVEDGDCAFLASFFEIFDNPSKLFLFPKENGLDLVLSLLQNQDVSAVFKSKCSQLLSVYADNDSLSDISPEESVELLDIEIRFLLEYMTETGLVPDNDITFGFSKILSQIMEKLPINEIYDIFQERFMELYSTDDGNIAYQCIAVYMLSEAISLYPSSFIPILETYFSAICTLLESENPTMVLSALVSYANNLNELIDFSYDNFGHLIEVLIEDSNINDVLSSDCSYLISYLCQYSPPDPELCTQIVQQSMENIETARSAPNPFYILECNTNIVKYLLARNPEIIDEKAGDIYIKCNELIAEDADIYYQLLDIIITTLEGLAGNENFIDTLNDVIQLCQNFIDSEDMVLIIYANNSLKKIIKIIDESMPQEEAYKIYVQIFNKLFEQCSLLAEDSIIQWQTVHIEALSTCIFITNIIHQMSLIKPLPMSITNQEIQKQFLQIYDSLLKKPLEQEIYSEIFNGIEMICCGSISPPNDTLRILIISITKSIKDNVEPSNPSLVSKLIEFHKNILYYLICTSEDKDQMVQAICTIDPNFFSGYIIPFAEQLLDICIQQDEEFDTISSTDIIDINQIVFSFIAKIPRSFIGPFIMARFPQSIEALQCEEPPVSSINLFINYLVILPDLGIQENVAPVFEKILQEIQESSNIQRLIIIIKTLINAILSSNYEFFQPFSETLENVLAVRLTLEGSSTTIQSVQLKENLLGAYALLLSNYTGEPDNPQHNYQIFCNNLPIERDYSCISYVFNYISVFTFFADLDTTEIVKKLIIQLAVPPYFIHSMGLDEPIKLINPMSLIKSLLSKFEDGGAEFIAETLQGNEKKIMYFVQLYERSLIYSQQFTNINLSDIDPNIPVEEYDLTGLSD